MTNNMMIRNYSQRGTMMVVVVFIVIFLIIPFGPRLREVSGNHSVSIPATSKHSSSEITNSSPQGPSATTPVGSRSCVEFPGSGDVQIIVKTGANEIFEKLPTQLLTFLRCFDKDNLLLISDLEQDIGTYHVYDVLSDVTESLKSSSYFEYYRTLQSLHNSRSDISKLGKEGTAAWDLDKFKFVHMLEKTWKIKPGRKWYVFIEADTYLIRTNLLHWLQRFDPTQKLYLGSPTSAGSETFAHGGSGIILSGAALAEFATPGAAARFDEKIGTERYGDQILMRALKEKKIDLTKVWPILQAESPATIPFGPGPDSGTRHWCQPIVTMHHITPDEASRLWEFEQLRKDHKAPLLIHEIYDQLMSPYTSDQRRDWDNVSDDVFYRAPGKEGGRQKKPEELSAIEKEAYKSFENCRKACEEQSRCYQFLFNSRDQECSFAHSFRLGGKKLGFRSGWPLDKIRRFEESNHCDSPEWSTGT